ncbi:MAG: signal peptidase I SipW [Bacillota bacterium]
MIPKTLMNILNKSVTTLLLILLVCIVFLIIASRAAGGEPNLFGYKLLTVLSGSMEPEIKTGSIILIKLEEETTNFEVGDVVTFKAQDNILITHRIVEVDTDGQRYITKGDNNNAPDPNPVIAENILAKYSDFTIPSVGYVYQFVNTRQGSVLLIILPGLLLLGHGAFTIWRSLKRMEATG